MLSPHSLTHSPPLALPFFPLCVALSQPPFSLSPSPMPHLLCSSLFNFPFSLHSSFSRLTFLQFTCKFPLQIFLSSMLFSFFLSLALFLLVPAFFIVLHSFSLLPPSPLFVLPLQSPHSLPIHIIHLPRLVLSTSSSSLTLVLPFLLSLPSFLYPFFLFICFSSPSLPQPPITLSPSSACASFPPAQPPSLTVT